MLRGLIERRSSGLAITKQTTAVAGITQPPQQNARAIGAPQRQTGLTQAAVGTLWVKVDQQFVAFIAILTDDLLRVLVQCRQGRVLRCIGFARQAQYQGIQRTAQSGRALFRLLAADRFTNLVQVSHGGSKGWQAEQRHTDKKQASGQTHGWILDGRKVARRPG